MRILGSSSDAFIETDELKGGRDAVGNFKEYKQSLLL
jgi:hypothetical protein